MRCLLSVYCNPAQRLSNEPAGTNGCAPLIRPADGTALSTCGACVVGRGAAAAGVSAFWVSVFCRSDFGSSFAVATLRGSAAGLMPASVVPCAAGCGGASLFGLNSRAKKPSLELVLAEATWLVLWVVVRSNSPPNRFDFCTDAVFIPACGSSRGPLIVGAGMPGWTGGAWIWPSLS